MGKVRKEVKGSFQHLFRIYLWALSFLKPYKWQLGLIIVLGLFITSSELIIPKFIQHIIDKVLPQKKMEDLTDLVLIIAGIVLLMIGLRAVRNLLQRTLVEKASRDSQFAAFQHMRDLGFAYFERKSVGETLSLMNVQSQAVQKIYQQYLPAMIEQSIYAAISLAFMLQLNVTLTLFLIPCFVLYSLFGPWFERKASIYGRTTGQVMREHNQKIYESVAAMTELRSFARETWDRDRIHHSFGVFRFNYLKYIYFAYLRGTFRRLTYYVGAIGVFLYGAVLIREGSLSTGEFIAFILYYFAGMHILTSIVTAVTEQKLLLFQIEPLHQFMQEVPEVKESQQPVRLPEVRGEFKFENVHFGYPNRPDVLNGFNLQIRPGERVALVGTSGGGKSTLLKIMGRFYDPRQGEISLDGVSLCELSFADLRESIGYVFQETYLFNTSILENIRFGNPNATDEEVIEAAKAAQCHDFILQLEGGYHARVGERGYKLSGGQKQRIAIARMLIKNPSIILLDEATSALDNVSEQGVQTALNRLFAGRSVIAVAHRLSTIKDFDLIVFVADGRNIEMGTYQELIDKKGHFYQLAVGHGEQEEVLA